MQGARAVVRGWRNLSLVREHDRERTKRLLLLLVGVLIALTPLAFYLIQQIEYVHLRYRIEELRAQHDRLTEAERRLRMERAALEALPHVEVLAHDAGLVPPTPERMVVVRRGRPAGAFLARDRLSPAVR